MLRSHFIFAATLLLSAPAVADIVDVTYSAVSGGSGCITALCFFGSGCGTDTQTFGLPGTGSADSGRVTMSGSVNNATTMTSNNVTAELDTSVTVDALGAHWGACAQLSDHYELKFTLTTESTSALALLPEGFVQSSDLTLQGPGLTLNGNFENVDLMPGMYTVDASYTTINYAFFPLGVSTHNTFSTNVVLGAEFTPIVPEPGWTFIIPALLVVMVLCVRRLRRGNRRALISS
ncbi:MAG TPA: hypothetical protein VMH80_22135 [Bryobacteraceae bacterium]|nr:hypothetical protein [Bryobacteraceae bacterium]